MIKLIPFLYLLAIVFSCNKKAKEPEKAIKKVANTVLVKEIKNVELTLTEAINLATLPLTCLQTEYPNKLGQTISNGEELKEPHVLHPAFYGCFDWHSAVHGHWSLIKLLKTFPNLKDAQEIKLKLIQNISKENIEAEIAYFKGKYNKSYERTYGWAFIKTSRRITYLG